MSTIVSGHYVGLTMSKKRRLRRLWEDEEKIWIVAQTRVPGVSVSQVARRLWLREFALPVSRVMALMLECEPLAPDPPNLYTRFNRGFRQFRPQGFNLVRKYAARL